ncbi:MAG: ABC transporter substrate-binding protein [Desulfatitalea sp.]|nr:penicillin-binding protein activator [Desulfatitalea sp.]NNJ99019.1 ABC transporter substrate-binding protein [Desulfatitalea sp.]
MQNLLFMQGQGHLDQGDLQAAMSAFNSYLTRFPDGPHTAAALQRIGLISQQQGDLGAAEAFYTRILSEYPADPAADTARLALIDLMTAQNRYEEAKATATQRLAEDPPAPVRIALVERLVSLHDGDTGVSQSASYLYQLYRLLPAPENASWAEALIQTIDKMNREQITALWDLMDDRRMRSHLMYRYAVVLVLEADYDDALEILNAFQASFPGHPHTPDAANLVEMLSRRLAFTPRTVGCLLPLSGAYEAYGRRALNAIEFALSAQPHGEGIAPIRLVVRDTASREQVAVQAVKELHQAGVGLILGPITTAPAAVSQAQQLAIPIIAFTQRPEITQAGDFVFRHFITPQSQVKTLIGYFSKELGLTDYAIMYPEENYGRTFMTAFWDEVLNQGGRMVGVESYSPEQTDFADTIKKLVGTYYPVPAELQARPVVQVEESPYFRDTSEGDPIDHLETLLPDPITRLSGLFHQDPDQDRIKGPALGRRSVEEQDRPVTDFDVLFIPDSPQMAGLILPQLAYYDVKQIYTVGTNLWHAQQLIDMTRKYAQNAVLVDGFYQDSDQAHVQRFVKSYTSIYGRKPGIIEAFAFDTASFVFSLLHQNDIHMRHELRDALKQMMFEQGVTGPTAFGPNGESIKRMTLLRIKGRRFVEIPRP